MTQKFSGKTLINSAFFAGGALLTIPVMQLLPTEAQIKQPVAQLPTVSTNSTDTNTNFITAAVEQASPSVVRITSARNSRAANRQPARGMGSGFIISPDGVVLTKLGSANGNSRFSC